MRNPTAQSDFAAPDPAAYHWGMLGGGSITLFHVRGIRIAVDWSWFLVLFLVIFWLSQFYGDVLGQSSSATGPFALAVVSALGFFGSILLHELGHAMVALRNGIGISSIQLWIFGGVARMDRESDSPATEFKVAIAGPLVTLAIVVALTAVGLAAAGPHEFEKAMLVESNAGISGVLAMVAWLASINFLVLVFNLLPAFPMDGGRVVRAIAWWRTGDRTSATRFAASLGRVFGYVFIAGGLLLVFRTPDLRGRLAGADRDGDQRLGPGGDGADGDLQPHRGNSRRRRDGPRAGRDPRRAERRAGPRRVLPALSLALVPGRRRGSSLPRPAGSRQSRRGARSLTHDLPCRGRARA